MIFNNVNLKPATGELGDQFIGLKIINNNIEFHYPETYVMPDDKAHIRKSIITILNTITLARTKTRSLSEYNNSSTDEYVLPLKSLIWMMKDYLKYGKYINQEKIFETGVKGKINWKKTMSSDPVVSNGNIIYLNIVAEVKNQKDNILTEIYYFCVQKSIDTLGWLFNIKFDSKGINYYKLFNKRRYILAIKEELNHTFNDEKKQRLFNMLNIITGLDSNIKYSNDLVYGVDSFEYVYEKLIDLLFLGVNNKKEFYPHAIWDLDIEAELKKSSNLRPDTIFIDKDNKKVFILDAKYYRYGTTFSPSNLPDTSSIQKQITYSEYAKQVRKGEFQDVRSAFIMPYSKINNRKKDKYHNNFEIVGLAKANWFPGQEKDNKVVAALLDTNFLIDNYSGNNIEDIKKMLNQIEDYLEEHKK